jgi:hypothetical protein
MYEIGIYNLFNHSPSKASSLNLAHTSFMHDITFTATKS